MLLVSERIPCFSPPVPNVREKTWTKSESVAVDLLLSKSTLFALLNVKVIILTIHLE